MGEGKEEDVEGEDTGVSPFYEKVSRVDGLSGSRGDVPV